MILIFDLDDTLYSEIDYTLSGFRHVAKLLAADYGIDPQRSYADMKQDLERNGRGKVFDNLLLSHALFSKKRIKDLVTAYRGHKPDIRMPAAHHDLLGQLSVRFPLYIITDGHKSVQRRKVDTLGVRSYVQRALLTNQYGRHNAKPSLYCFDLIRKWEKTDWSRMVYVGDNPTKDFLPLNRMGGTTVRVHSGPFAKTKAAPGYDAGHQIEKLVDLPDALGLLP